MDRVTGLFMALLGYIFVNTTWRLSIKRAFEEKAKKPVRKAFISTVWSCFPPYLIFISFFNPGKIIFGIVLVLWTALTIYLLITEE